MRELLIYEHELDDVALLNTLVTGFSSAASGFAFLVIGIVANALMQDKITDKATGMLWFGIPTGIVLTIGFAGAALISQKIKASRLATMKAAAVDIGQPESPVPAGAPTKQDTAQPALDADTAHSSTVTTSPQSGPDTPDSSNSVA